MGASLWGPPRMIAAIVLGREVLPPPASFAIGIVITAMVIHFILAWIYAAVFAWLCGGLGTGTAVGVGALYGLVIYLVGGYPSLRGYPSRGDPLAGHQR